MKAVTTTVLLSGEAEILRLASDLRKHRVQIISDTDIPNAPADALKAEGRYVLISHGDTDGSVYLHRTDWGPESRQWLSTSTKPIPRCARLMLFSCYGGRSLHRAMKKSVVWGHPGPVPLPVGMSKEILFEYYLLGLKLIKQSGNTDEWARTLREFAQKKRKFAFARRAELEYRIWDEVINAFA